VDVSFKDDVTVILLLGVSYMVKIDRGPVYILDAFQSMQLLSFLRQNLFFFIFKYFLFNCFICHLSDSTVSEDAEIEPGTVATSALAV
jgi:hypothetical protein